MPSGVQTDRRVSRLPWHRGIRSTHPGAPRDLAFLHDVSGLVNVPEAPCTFVSDNGGGGIFSFLPQAAALDHRRFRVALRHTADLRM